VDGSPRSNKAHQESARRLLLYKTAKFKRYSDGPINTYFNILDSATETIERYYYFLHTSSIVKSIGSGEISVKVKKMEHSIS